MSLNAPNASMCVCCVIENVLPAFFPSVSNPSCLLYFVLYCIALLCFSFLLCVSVRACVKCESVSVCFIDGVNVFVFASHLLCSFWHHSCYIVWVRDIIYTYIFLSAHFQPHIEQCVAFDFGSVFELTLFSLRHFFRFKNF